jgi:hypothetical protein
MKPTIDSIDYSDMHEMLQHAANKSELFDLAVNTPFVEYAMQTNFLFLGIIVLLLVNKKTGMIDRVALSNTDLAKRTTDVSVVPFNEIKIGIDEPDNIIAQAIRSGEMKDTTDWKFLFTPSLTAAEARINQANAGIAYSAVLPIEVGDGGALIFSYYQYPELIGKTQHDFMNKYSQFVALGLNKHEALVKS